MSPQMSRHLPAANSGSSDAQNGQPQISVGLHVQSLPCARQIVNIVRSLSMETIIGSPQLRTTIESSVSAERQENHGVVGMGKQGLSHIRFCRKHLQPDHKIQATYCL